MSSPAAGSLSSIVQRDRIAGLLPSPSAGSLRPSAMAPSPASCSMGIRESRPQRHLLASTSKCRGLQFLRIRRSPGAPSSAGAGPAHPTPSLVPALGREGSLAAPVDGRPAPAPTKKLDPAAARPPLLLPEGGAAGSSSCLLCSYARARRRRHGCGGTRAWERRAGVGDLAVARELETLLAVERNGRAEEQRT
jgi:hypothetical protein